MPANLFLVFVVAYLQRLLQTSRHDVVEGSDVLRSLRMQHVAVLSSSLLVACEAAEQDRGVHGEHVTFFLLFWRMSFARYRSVRRFGGGALANSLSQTSTTRGASRLWNCTHSESVSMLACVELSLASLSVRVAGLKAMATQPLDAMNYSTVDATSAVRRAQQGRLCVGKYREGIRSFQVLPSPSGYADRCFCSCQWSVSLLRHSAGAESAARCHCLHEIRANVSPAY